MTSQQYLETVNISSEVISSIIEISIQETGLAALEKKKNNIIVKSTHDAVLIDVDISVIKDNPIPAIVTKIQETISSNLELMTSLSVLAVNVNVCSLMEN